MPPHHVDAGLPQRRDIVADELRARGWRARAGQAIDKIFRQMRGLRRRQQIDKDAAAAAIIVLDIVQLWNDLGRELRAHAFGARAVVVEIAAFDQLSFGAAHDMGRGHLAEQFRADFVVDADENSPQRKGLGEVAGDRLLEAAVVDRRPGEHHRHFVGDAAERRSDLDLAVRHHQIPRAHQRQQRQRRAKDEARDGAGEGEAAHHSRT